MLSHSARVAAKMAREELGTETRLVDLPPTPAFAVVALLLAGFLATAPLAHLTMSRIDAFLPAVVAAISVIDFITSTLLFAHFSIYRSRALLALASGYLFTALIVIPNALTFPGAFSPNGLLGASPQSAGWLYFFWHTGFAAGVPEGPKGYKGRYRSVGELCHRLERRNRCACGVWTDLTDHRRQQSSATTLS
jgi:hypothetical protein